MLTEPDIRNAIKCRCVYITIKHPFELHKGQTDNDNVLVCTAGVKQCPVSPCLCLWSGGGGRQAGVMRLVLVQPNTAAALAEPHTQSSSGASPKTATPTSAAATTLLLPEGLFQIYCHLC